MRTKQPGPFPLLPPSRVLSPDQHSKRHENESFNVQGHRFISRTSESCLRVDSFRAAAAAAVHVFHLDLQRSDVDDLFSLINDTWIFEI